jgi:glycosyltransferase involved in cell wall biosynthesis
LRILHVPHAYHPVIGGAELICERVSEILAGQGHDVQVLTTDVGAVQAYYEFGVERVAEPNEVLSGVSIKRLKFSDVIYFLGGWVDAHLRPRWLGTRLAGRTQQFLYKRLDRGIAREIARIRPDVVMTMPHLVVNVQAVLSARSRTDFPLVMVPMLHEHDANWNIPSMAKALSIADAVVVLTGHEGKRLTESYGVAPEKIFLGSVGVDLAPSPPISKETPERVLFLGRKVRSKGIGDLIEAMRLVWRERWEVELILAGVRLPETVEMDSQIAALSAPERSRIVEYGTLSGKEKDDLLRSVRCLVLPSRIESFGMVILDAWAHKKPIITWDLPVFRSIVDDGVTGLLADANCGVSALAAAILRLLRNPEEANRMGLSGYEVAAARYSWNTVAAAYLDAYHYAIRAARR